MCRTITIPVVSQGSGTRSLTLREGHRLRMFENRVLRRLYGSKKREVTAVWRKLHREELHKLYCSPNIGKIIKSERKR
jgi:hypothetical protein